MAKICKIINYYL